MTRPRDTVCVIGGGISGLVVAHSLGSHNPAPKVVMLEASDRLGGALRTDALEGAPVEAGADSFLARSPDAVELCESLGLGGELIAPAVFGASIWSGGRLVQLPPDFVFGMPASPRSALRAAHLPPWGRIRASLEPFLPGARIHADVSVGDVVRRRYGRAVLESSVDPLLAGTRAGRASEMSLEAALPQVWGLVRERRSITRALARGRAENLIPQDAPPFKSLAGGLERLVAALRAQSGDAEVRTETRVESVEVDGSRFGLKTNAGRIECDAVVAATPSHEAARMLQTVNHRAAASLRSIEFASVATIALVYPPSAGGASLPGSGMLVPSSASGTVSASTWYSVKWPHTAPSDGGLVLRCFVGRSDDEPALELPDDELGARVAREMSAALGLTGQPRTSRVTRWPRSLPQYRVGHVATVDRIEAALGATPGIWVTGASYRGSGIPDCIRHARATAGRVLEWLEP